VGEGAGHQDRIGEFSPVVIAGPTAVGKSEIALLLAEQLRGEIVSVDSMQVYRGMDIGTAKPSAEERRRVPHHLLDLVEVNESFDAARFAALAHKAIAEIQSRNRVPILTGGTGLYFKAVLEGVGKAPAADAALRAELDQTPLAQLLEELRRSDPALYERIDRKNRRRVVRAVEVIRLTGRPFSEQRTSWTPGGSDTEAAVEARRFVLTRSPDDLRRRIDQRVDEMFRRGLVKETRRLVELFGGSASSSLGQALGYRQVLENLRGERSLPETVELIKIRTRQYAKRQLTWFRRHMSAQWIDLQADSKPTEAAQRIVPLMCPA